MGAVALAAAPSAGATTLLHIGLAPKDGVTSGPSITIINPGNGTRYTLDAKKFDPTGLNGGTTAAWFCRTLCLPVPGIGIGFADITQPNGQNPLASLGSTLQALIQPSDPEHANSSGLTEDEARAAMPDALKRLVLFPGENVPTDTLGNHIVLVAAFDLDSLDPAQMGFGIEAAAYAVDPPVYRDLVTAQGPIAYWRLNDKLGSPTMADLTSGHNGTYMGHIALGRDGAPNCGVASRVTGGCNGDDINLVAGLKRGGNLIDDPNVGAAYFNGIDAYTSADNFALPYQAYTIQAWVKPDNTSDMGIFQHGSGGMLGIRDGHFIFNPSSNFQSPVVTSSKPVSDYGSNHGWYFLTATWDGTTAKLYVNGTDQNGKPDYLAQYGKPDASVTGVTGLGPSTSTVYVGRVNTLPLFHGSISEVAYYDKAIADPDAISDEWETATYEQPMAAWPALLPVSIPPGAGQPRALDTTVPTFSSSNIVDGGLYSPDSPKNPTFISVHCSDPDELIGTEDLCFAAPPVFSSAPGQHTVLLNALDSEVAAALLDKSIPKNYREMTIHYYVKPYADIINTDSPIAYYRLGDAADSTVMADSSATNRDGQYKNDQRQGGPGVTGDKNNTREFLGAGGYGYANNIAAPQFAYTLEGWVNPADSGDMMILQHGGAGALFIRNGRLVFRQGEVEVTGPAPTPGVWTYVAGTFDGSHLRLYERASSAGRPDTPDEMVVGGPKFAWLQQVDAPSGSGTFYVGYGDQVHTNTPWFRGQIDEIAYFSKALSDERLYEHWLADPPPVAPKSAVVTGLIVPQVQSGPHVSMRMNVIKHNSRVQVEVYGLAAQMTAAKPGGKTPKLVLLGRLVRTHVSGRVGITVQLNAKGRRALNKHHVLSVKVIVRVTPPHGKAQQATRTVTLRP